MQLRYYPAMLLGLLLLAVFGTTGCQQEAERLTLTGNEFELYEARFYNEPGTDTTNALRTLLPNWSPEHARYVLTFEEAGRLAGWYFVADTLVHAAVGAWSQPDAGQLYLRVDRDFDGLFNLEDTGNGEYALRTSSNRSLREPDTTRALELRLRRR